MRKYKLLREKMEHICANHVRKSSERRSHQYNNVPPLLPPLLVMRHLMLSWVSVERAPAEHPAPNATQRKVNVHLLPPSYLATRHSMLLWVSMRGGPVSNNMQQPIQQV